MKKQLLLILSLSITAAHAEQISSKEFERLKKLPELAANCVKSADNFEESEECFKTIRTLLKTNERFQADSNVIETLEDRIYDRTVHSILPLAPGMLAFIFSDNSTLGWAALTVGLAYGTYRLFTWSPKTHTDMEEMARIKHETIEHYKKLRKEKFGN